MLGTVPVPGDDAGRFGVQPPLTSNLARCDRFMPHNWLSLDPNLLGAIEADASALGAIPTSCLVQQRAFKISVMPDSNHTFGG